MTKTLYGIALIALVTVSCSRQADMGRNCVVKRESDGARISCPNVDSILIKDGIDGAPGSTGPAGENGSDGRSTVFTVLPVAPTCPNGGSTILMGYDADGDNLFSIADDDIQSGEICNGVAGANGSNGQDAPPTPFTPVGLVNPCGDAPGVYDEVFIQLSSGTLLASFSDNIEGRNTRFAVITPGTYMTTDGDNCTFTVNSSNGIINESHQN